MPVAFNLIEAYGKRWYGLVLLPCQGPNCYRRCGRLEIQIPDDDVAEMLRKGDEGIETHSVDPNIRMVYMNGQFIIGTSSSGSNEARHSLADGRVREIVLM
jgi:hypothetical protein